MSGARPTALLAACAALLVAACTARLNPLDTEQLVTVRASIERALAQDDLDDALQLAQAYERRVPGPDAAGALGRVLWRSGALLQAEALFRRSAAGGDPEGRLGLARALASRGQQEEAVELATPLLEIASTRRGAARLLAAIAWARGDGAAAAARLRVAAEDAGAERALADALDAAAAGGWQGRQASVPLAATGEGVPLLEARAAGRRVRLALALDARRSWLAPEAAAAGGAGDGSVAVLDLELSAGLTYRSAILQVREPDEGQAARAIDGALGFDLLSLAVWEVDLVAGRLLLAPPGAAEPDLTRPPLRRTQWLQARVLRDGVAAQLLVMPRVDGRVVTAAIDLGARTLLDRRVAASWLAPGQTLPEGPLLREVRFGAWRQGVQVQVADLSGRAHGGAVAPQAVLGRDLLEGWRLRWLPSRRELSARPSIQ